MMRVSCLAVVFLLAAQPALAGDPAPKPLATGLQNPSSVAVGRDGRVYVAVVGEPDKEGTGEILVLDKEGKPAPFVKGLDEPRGLAAANNQPFLFVADKQRIWRIDPKGKATIFTAAEAFPTPPHRLVDLTVDYDNGMLYISDSQGGQVFVIGRPGQAPVVLAKGLQSPADLCLDSGGKRLLLADRKAGTVTALPAQVPGAEVDETPLPVEAVVAFPQLKW